ARLLIPFTRATYINNYSQCFRCDMKATVLNSSVSDQFITIDKQEVDSDIKVHHCKLLSAKLLCTEGFCDRTKISENSFKSS
ncbi:hypothetical protein SK128_007268, partial [Halocaridina rubra]